MTITYLGHSCFKIKGTKTTVLCDPFDPKEVGLTLPKQEADIVTVSHNHTDHNFVEKLEGEYFLANTPGEYEIKGVMLEGIDSYHDAKEGKERGKNTMFHIKMDGFNIVHLGDLGHKLTDEQVSALNTADILMIPTGGIYTINSEVATEVISQLEPSIVLPMHYKKEGMLETFDKLQSLNDFLKAMGEEAPKKMDKLTLKAPSELPQETEVIILE